MLHIELCNKEAFMVLFIKTGKFNYQIANNLQTCPTQFNMIFFFPKVLCDTVTNWFV